MATVCTSGHSCSHRASVWAFRHRQEARSASFAHQSGLTSQWVTPPSTEASKPSNDLQCSITCTLCVGLRPVKLFVSEKQVRAWPGGVGDAKVAPNYGPTILPQQQAEQAFGTAQVRETGLIIFNLLGNANLNMTSCRGRKSTSFYIHRGFLMRTA